MTAVSSWEAGSREFSAGNNPVRLAEVLGLDPVEVMKVDGKSATARKEVQLLAAFRSDVLDSGLTCPQRLTQ